MTGVARRAIHRFAPGLAALGSYDPAWIRYDLLAGVSVAAVAVPIAIAYSQLAGLPPVYGLYASILPLVAYAVFGTSRQLIMAPDAATCAIVAAVVMPLAGPDPARYLSLSMTLAMMTGVFCIVAGLMRLGFLTNFLARPILAGYLNGIAISIISGQLGKLFGFSVKSSGFFRLLAEFVSKLGETHGPTLTVGLAVFALLRLLKRLAPRIPAPLIGVALGITASQFFRLGERGVALLGTIPAGLPKLMIPEIGMSDWGPLALGAVGLALISFNSAMVTARGFAVKNRYEIDSNQEFIALGVADIGAGMLQGFAVSGADSRTAVNDSVGGKSQVTGLVAGRSDRGDSALFNGTARVAAHRGTLSGAGQLRPRSFRSSRPGRTATDQSPGVSPLDHHAAWRHHCRRASGGPGRGRCCDPATSGQGLTSARRSAGTDTWHRWLSRHQGPPGGRDHSRAADIPL